MFHNIKTSKKVSLYFSFFSFISLIILLLWVNIIYFSIWYNDQKNESIYDMNMNYKKYSIPEMNTWNKKSFKDYILQKDAVIIWNDWQIVCSNSVSKKTHDTAQNFTNKLFFKDENKIYLIFSEHYDEIGEVKIFFDTTPYIKSQVMIIKISFFIILFSVIFHYFLWEFIVKKSLKNLNIIKNYCQKLDINETMESLKIDGNSEDEIIIVAEKLNTAFTKIKNQNENLKQFIADVSHEFKTPLMALNSKNDLFTIKNEKNILDKNEITDFLDYNKKYIKKLDKMLEALFLITRLKDKTIQLYLIKTHIRSHISTLIKEKQIKNIEIQWDLELKIDHTTFDIIIENLINNAIKYGNNKKIILLLNKKFISIKDNGIWINQENLDKLFDNFFQENNESEWFWIGLYLVKRLLDIYEWKIEVFSEKWKGSEFKIYF